MLEKMKDFFLLLKSWMKKLLTHTCFSNSTMIELFIAQIWNRIRNCSQSLIHLQLFFLILATSFALCGKKRLHAVMSITFWSGMWNLAFFWINVFFLHLMYITDFRREILIHPSWIWIWHSIPLQSIVL